jgi:hypothetical protein
MGIALRTVSRLLQPIPPLLSKKNKKRQAVAHFSTSVPSTIFDGTQIVGTPGKGWSAAGNEGNRFSPTSGMEWWGKAVVRHNLYCLAVG